VLTVVVLVATATLPLAAALTAAPGAVTVLD
jgi:hypothetical protein